MYYIVTTCTGVCTYVTTCNHWKLPRRAVLLSWAVFAGLSLMPARPACLVQGRILRHCRDPNIVQVGRGEVGMLRGDCFAGPHPLPLP